MRKPTSSAPQPWSSAYWSLSSLSTQALGPMEISLMVIMTLLVLGSIAIFLEAAVYVHKNTRCPIKRKTLLWCSSSPTVRVLQLPLGRG